MISYFDIQNLNDLLQDFYTAIGIRISIFDDEYKLVTEFPKKAPEFCANVRKTEEGAMGCRNCDHEACMRAKKMGKPHIYTCHAGLIEAITPIQLSGGVVGYAILAHMMPLENYEHAINNACRLVEMYGVKKEESLKALKNIVPRSAKQIHASVRLLDAVSAYVQIRNLAKWKNETIAQVIDDYIKRNLADRISAKIICDKFHCSRSVLYQIAINAFGTGIMEYVFKCRMENAKKMLTSGNSIAETAAANGYEDYSYFCRAFKRYAGCTPAEYRRLNN